MSRMAASAAMELIFRAGKSKLARRAGRSRQISRGRLSKWSDADFIKTICTGKRPDGTELNPVMPRTFGQMDDGELKALWAFFKTTSPVATGVR